MKAESKDYGPKRGRKRVQQRVYWERKEQVQRGERVVARVVCIFFVPLLVMRAGELQMQGTKQGGCKSDAADYLPTLPLPIQARGRELTS
ncbi:hypothetical protein IF1G_03519 [Cordyceps javanica]|uniref:Uncharacterized protein n=1 Tax=Cordyceps javanica TaxID=43265 RepID=A0A545V7S9_9HYPO|nr:hypothetical protein IF1G_03519 [Cordyceps javanica]